MLNKKHIYLILVGLCFLAYANSLNNKFLLIDDIPAILENPQIFHPLNFWAEPSSLLNSFIYKIAKFNVVPYHLANIILHSLVTILVFHFLRLFFKVGSSLLSAALFALHPVHTEAVTWVSGRPYIILVLFTLATYFLYYRATNRDNINKKSRYLNYVLSIAIFTYFINKNYSFYFLFPFFIILSDIVFGRWRKNYKFWLPFLGLTILRVILARGIIYERVIFNQIYILGSAKTWVNPIPPFIYSIFSYLWLLLWPMRLTLYHEPIVFYPLAMWAGFIVLIVFTCSLPYIFKKAKSIFLGIGIFVLFLAPTYSPLHVASIVTERYAYLPSIFLSILAAFYYERYSKKSNGKKRIWITALFMLLIAAYGVRTIIRNTDWKDHSRFSRVTLGTSPNSLLAHYNMGAVYLKEGNMDKAIEEFNTALKFNPNLFQAYTNRGSAYQIQGNLNQAISDYNQVLKLNPYYVQAYNNRGLVYQVQGNLNQALSDYNQALKLNPNYPEVYYNRGLVYKAQGNLNQALSDYNQALKLNPNYIEVYYNRGLVYQVQGNLNQALSDYNQALKLNPDLFQSYNNRGIVYFNQGNLNQALSDYNQALKLNPNYIDAYYNRALAYFLRQEYGKSWEDVYKIEALGYKVSPEFLRKLKEASKRYF